MVHRSSVAGHLSKTLNALALIPPKSTCIHNLCNGPKVDISSSDGVFGVKEQCVLDWLVTHTQHTEHCHTHTALSYTHTQHTHSTPHTHIHKQVSYEGLERRAEQEQGRNVMSKSNASFPQTWSNSSHQVTQVPGDLFKDKILGSLGWP